MNRTTMQRPTAIITLVSFTLLLLASAVGLRFRAHGFQPPLSLRAYVANFQSNTVSVIDLTTNNTSSVSVRNRPLALVVSPDQQRVYVANSATNIVSVIDTMTNTVSNNIQLSGFGTRATGLALSYDGSRLYVANAQGNNVFEVDTANFSVDSMNIGSRSVGLVWTDMPEPRLYISTPEDGGVTFMDVSGPNSSRRTGLIETGQNPFGLALSPDGRTVYVADPTESKVSVISTSNHAVRSFPVGNGPDSLALTPDGEQLVVASLRSSEVNIVDPDSGATIASVPALGSSMMLNRPGFNRITVAPDGLSAVVANEDSDTITIIDLKTFAARAAMTGDQPSGVAVVGHAAVLVPDQTTIHFGDVPLTRGVHSQDLLITNRGTDILRITNASLDNPAFEMDSLSSPIEIAPRATRRLTIRFRPTQPREERGTLSLQTNDPDPARATILLQGTGRSPLCSVSPTVLDFGAVGIGQSLEQAVTVSNTGNQDLTISAVASNNPQFGLSNSQLPPPIQPGASQRLRLRFIPQSIGMQSAQLRLVGNDPASNRCIIMAQGVGQGALCQAPSDVNFGDVRVFQSSAPQLITLSNAGNEPLIISRIGMGDPQFALSTFPALPATLAPGNSLSFAMTFTPNSVGEKTTPLTIVSNHPGGCPVRLRGTGRGSQCQLPPQLDFGDLALGRFSDRTINVANAGNEDLTVFSASLQGDAGFQLLPLSFPLTIRPGGQQGLTVRFTVLHFDVHTATLVLNTNDPLNSTCSASLRGAGRNATCEVFPSILDFGNTLIGRSADPQLVTITNRGNEPLRLNRAVVESDALDQFRILSPTLPVNVSPNTSLSVAVQFTAKAANLQQATLRFDSNAPDPALCQIVVRGFGLGAVCQITPSQLDFGIVDIEQFRDLTVELSNTGNLALQLNQPIIEGAGMTQFQLIGPTPFRIEPGVGFLLTVRFTPSAVGEQRATLRFGSNDPDQMRCQVQLRGEGRGPICQLPEEVNFGDVSTGQTRVRRLMISNAGTGILRIVNIFTNDPAFQVLSPLPSSVSVGEQAEIQVRFAPTVQGSQTATLTVQTRSPNNICTTRLLGIGGVPDVNEPNDGPQQAILMTPGSSVTGNATVEDEGFVVQQLIDECNTQGLIQDWFRFDVSARAAFQVSLDFSGSDVDYDLALFRANDGFSQNLQLVTVSAQPAGSDEQTAAQVLEPGFYYIGVTRFHLDRSSDSRRVSYRLSLIGGGSPELHAIEDAVCERFLGPERFAGNGVFVVNRVKPTEYPARLQSITVLLRNHLPSPNGELLRIVVFADAMGSGAPPPLAHTNLLVNQTTTIRTDGFLTGSLTAILNLGNAGPLITAGDFYVGYELKPDTGVYPDLGRELFPGIRSFLSSDNGGSYQMVDFRTRSGQPGNVMIRATVNTNPAP